MRILDMHPSKWGRFRSMMYSFTVINAQDSEFNLPWNEGLPGLVIAGVNPNIKESALIKLFQRYGTIVREHILFERDRSGRRKPIGAVYVEFKKQSQADACEKALHGKKMKGHKLSVYPINGEEEEEFMKETSSSTVVKLMKKQKSAKTDPMAKINRLESKILQLEHGGVESFSGGSLAQQAAMRNGDVPPPTSTADPNDFNAAADAMPLITQEAEAELRYKGNRKKKQRRFVPVQFGGRERGDLPPTTEALRQASQADSKSLPPKVVGGVEVPSNVTLGQYPDQNTPSHAGATATVATAAVATAETATGTGDEASAGKKERPGPYTE